MKKLVIWFMLLAMLLTACGEKPESAPTESSAPAVTQPTAPADTQPSEEESASTEASTEPAGPAVATKDPIVPEFAKCPTGYQLTQVGTFTESDWDMGFRSDDVIVHREHYPEFEENRDTMLGIMGQPVYEGPFRRIETITDDILAVSPYSEDINTTALITAEGEVLIDYECAYIDTLLTDWDNSLPVKYLKVIYSTGVTTNEDEAFFYITDSFFSLSPDEDDQLHTGYARIYDLENRRFLDFTITNPSVSAVQACGEYLLIEEDESYTVYDDQGNVSCRFNLNASIDCGWNYLTVYQSGTEYLYGADGSLYYATDNSLSVLSPNYVYETVYSGDSRSCTIRDIYGHEVLALEGDWIIHDEKDGVFLIEKDDVYVLVDANGKELLQSSSSPTYRGYGYWSYSEREGDNYRYFMVKPDGTVLESKYISNLMLERETELGKEYYVLSTGDFTLSINAASYSEMFHDGLMRVRTPKGYGLYDLFSGQELLAPTYRQIGYAYGRVYAYADGVWTVYEVTLNP